MFKFRKSFFLPSLIYLLCASHWCNSALVLFEETENERVAGNGNVEPNGRILVLDQAQNTLMPAQYNGTLYVDHLNMLISQLPILKMGLMNTIFSVALPLLQIMLLISMIALSVTGTLAVLCAAFDCSDLFGFVGHNHHRPYTSNFLKKNFRTSQYLNGVQPYYNYAAKQPWNSFDATQNLLDEAYDKFEAP